MNAGYRFLHSAHMFDAFAKGCVAMVQCASLGFIYFHIGFILRMGLVLLRRLQGVCKACPNTAWLLFLGFFLALLGMVAIAVYLNRKRINLAGLSIGVVSVPFLHR